MNRNNTGLGTLGGVFVPNILTILGVIMYLRLGWVVGNAGLHGALMIVLIANLITLFTAFSISMISTNMRVKGGGAYYMISRSLGQEAGGSIGIPLFLAQALGIGLYIVGFTEAVNNLFPHLDPLIIRGTALTALVIIAIISTKVVVKIQYFILLVVVLSLVSFFLGKFPDPATAHKTAAYLPGENFWSVFAVFFPAVTGILSGVSMSGDLKDPGKSIPRGTINAVLVSILIYGGLSFWLALAAKREELLTNNTIVISLAKWAPLVYAGIWGATLSSALASILTAPRTLQALARDGVMLKFLGSGRGKSNEPITATIFTYLLVLGVLYVGDLNTIAPVLTMFFLITYGSMNFIAFTESSLRRPGFRPTFSVHWFIPLLGAISCVWVMFVINVWACVIGFSFVAILYFLLKRGQLQKNWGDVRTGIWSAMIQYSLVKLGNTKYHPRNWRPNILIYSQEEEHPEHLMEIAAVLTKKSGFTSLMRLKSREENKRKREVWKASGETHLRKGKRTPVFYREIFVDETLPGQLIATQAHGIGSFLPNTVMLEWPFKSGDEGSKMSKILRNQLKLVRYYRQMEMSTLLVNCKNKLPRKYQKIDLWWDPEQDNGSFMLMLAHLIASNQDLIRPSITIKTVVLEEKAASTRFLLEELIRQSRIKADIQVLHPDPGSEKKLEIRYNRILEATRRKNQLAGYIAGLLNKRKEEEHATLLYGSSIPEEDDSSEDERPDEEEEEIKEQISQQVEEKDSFIIKQNIREIIRKESTRADLILLGYNVQEKEQEQKYITKMSELLQDLPDTILIQSPLEMNLFE